MAQKDDTFKTQLAKYKKGLTKAMIKPFILKNTYRFQLQITNKTTVHVLKLIPVLKTLFVQFFVGYQAPKYQFL